MTGWWFVDTSGHKRGPLNDSQMVLMIHLCSITSSTLVFDEKFNSWMTFSSCDSLQDMLLHHITEDNSRLESLRLPISSIPPLETMPCCDSSCPFVPSCDTVYIWDRAFECWLTFDEYVSVCREQGLVDGLPDRVLASSGDQINELFRGLGRPLENDDEPLSDPEKEAKRLKRRMYRERKKLKREAGVWSKSSVNPNVYVSSLPINVTVADLVALFKQAGQLKEDVKTGLPRVRLYPNQDALVTYLHPESVPLAISRFNEYEICAGTRICVQIADWTREETSVLSQTELEALAEANRDSRKRTVEFARKEKQLKSAWADGSSGLPILVFERSPSLNEHELRASCERFGTVTKLKTLPGYICVKFEDMSDAETCLAAMPNAFLHDGRDLSLRLGTEPISEEAKSPHEETEQTWESFMEEGVDSDDEDIQIRTE